MNRKIKIALLCAALILSCLLTACRAPALKQDEEGGFRNPQTGVSYYPTSPNYYAKPFGEEPYARIKVEGGGEDIQLFEIEGVDPEKYLVSNGYSVYAAGGAELPALADLPCVRVGIYDTQVSSNDGNITTAAEIQALKALHKSGTYTSLNNVGLYMNSVQNWYDLHFMVEGTDDKIYYQLKYGVFTEDVIITELVEKDASGNFIDLYPGISYELAWEIYDGKEYQVAKYNFGKEILCDVSTGNCYKIEQSLLSYVTPEAEEQ
jgi:hypothetical protein